MVFVQDDLNARAPEQFFVFIQAWTIVEIAQHNQIISCGQMRVDTLAQPDTLGQLFAPVFDRHTCCLGVISGAVRGLGFRMHTDQPDCAARCGLEGHFKRRFAPGDHLWRRVSVHVDAEHAV